MSPSPPRLISAPSVICLFAAAILSLLALTPSQALAIAHGSDAPSNAYPFAVNLAMTDMPLADGTHINSTCSGALIAPQWIITAGHCFHDENETRTSGTPPYPTRAGVGGVEPSSPVATRAVVDIRQSPSTDIAVAKLASPITDVRPLPVSSAPPRAGEIIRSVGWGATDDSPNAPPTTHLQTGEFSVTDVFEQTMNVTGHSPARDTSACNYDTGAPYFAEYEAGHAALVAVESDGPACPHAQQDAAGRVDNIANWIVKQQLADDAPNAR